MQKTVTKIIGVCTLVLFIMSVTGAAATCTPIKVYSDKFNLSPSKNSGNVLSNDKGTGITVVSSSKCTNSGKVSLRSNGIFTYTPVSSSKTTVTDSFTYTIKDRCGKRSSAKVVINYKKNGEGTGTPSVIEVTELGQINTALKNGPVFLKLGAEWCQYCQKMKPIMKEMAKEYQGKVTIMSADVDKSPKLANYFGVTYMPDSCVIVGMKDGKYTYMKQNGDITTDRSQAAIVGYYEKQVFEKVINMALKK